MDLLNLKLPYIGEIIKFGTYHDLSYNGWVCNLTTFRDNGIQIPFEKIIGIQWFNPKTSTYRTHKEMINQIFNL